MSAYSDAVVDDGATTYLRFGESSGTTAYDAIGGANNHTYENSPTLGASSLLAGDTANTAVSWDGTNDRTWENSPTSALDIGDKFSIEFWVKRTRTGAEEYIWGRNWSGAVAVYINSSDKVTLTKSGYGDIASSTTTITDTNPHHVVITKDGSTVKIWLDGNDVTGTVTNYTIGAVSGGSFHCWKIFASSYFKGTLDEFAVYKNVALTGAQVQVHCDLGFGNTWGAALSGSGTLSATAAAGAAITGAAALTGDGTLAAAGVRTRQGAVSLTGSGTLAADGAVARAAGVALRGFGRLSYHRDRPTTIGVCVHPGWTDKTYNDYVNCFSDIDELGTRLLRGGSTGDGNITQWLSRCASRGAQMIYGPPDAISGITSSWLDTLESQMTSYPGVICAVEGLNEPDLNSYGEQEPGESSVEYALRHQKALFNAVHGRFPELPILAPSIAGNSGWSEPLANRVTDYCTVANVHYYTSGGTAAVSQSDVNTVFSNARAYAGVTEVWVTETGIRSPVTGCTDAEGATRLYGILNAMRITADYPAVRVCVYQLESPDTVWDAENDWALYYYGFTPKAKATELATYIDGYGAALSGTGTLAATGVSTGGSGAALSGTGTLAATGEFARVGAAALSGDGTLAAAGVRTRLGAATLDGSGALAVGGTRTALTAAALSGAGTLVAGGVRLTATGATATGTGTLAAGGERTTFNGAALAGTGTLSASTSGGTAADAHLSGVGVLAATAVVSRSTGAAASGSGSLAASGLRTTEAQAALTGAGTLTSTGTRTRFGAVALAGTGTLTASFIGGASGAAALTGTGTLAAAGGYIRVATAALSGSGALSAAGIPQRHGSASLSGTGVLGADGYALVTTGAGLLGSGVLSAVAYSDAPWTYGGTDDWTYGGSDEWTYGGTAVPLATYGG